MGTNNKQAPGDNPGYVYLIRRGLFYKAGHAQSVYLRLKTIKDVVTPIEARMYPVEVIWSLYCSDKITTERALHQRLVGYHCGVGEWFILPVAIVEWVCGQTEAEICAKYDPKQYRRTSR